MDFFFTVVSISYVVLSPRDALNRHYTVENILIGALWMIMWHRDETAFSKMLVGSNTGVKVLAGHSWGRTWNYEIALSRAVLTKLSLFETSSFVYVADYFNLLSVFCIQRVSWDCASVLFSVGRMTGIHTGKKTEIRMNEGFQMLYTL